MKKTLLVLSLLACGCSSSQITQAISEASKVMEGQPAPTTDQVAAGLKEALVKGISNGAENVSKTNGYFNNPQIKIPFPPDIRKVEDRLRQIGLGKEVDRFVETLNHGAENAAREAKPIFISAIQQMTFDDAWGILKGQQDAATQYLKKTTTPQLKAKFKPVIQNALDQVEATRYYSDIVTTYNRIPFVEKVNPDLNEYATDLAMQGLFVMIAQEEKKIRENPLERTSDLLKRVFEYQK
ncbi:MAG TPA: DUF4197 domain-containing protein [Cyclobacteriaceae bacterium]|nr:DUF4197 domain-containing protein [Cyclobacteriaceae bacterium]